MGRIDIVIPDELENELRDEAHIRYMGRKGSLSKCAIIAIEFWIKAQKEKRHMAAKKAHITRKSKKK